MEKQDIDKILAAIDDFIVVDKDIDEALEDGKISFLEGSGLVLKHGGKAIRFIKSLKELGQEIVDVDSEETEKILNALSEVYDPTNPLVKSGIKKIAIGAVNIKEGIRELAEAKLVTINVNKTE